MISTRPYQPEDRDPILQLLADVEAKAREAFPALLQPDIDSLATHLDRALGFEHAFVAHDERGALVGHLAFIGPWNPFHGDHTGVWAPIHAFSASGPHIDRTVTALFRAAADQESLAGVDTWAISTLLHNPDVTRALSMNGFGARVSDAVVAIDDIPPADPAEGVTIAEFPREDAVKLLELKQGLDRHLTESPGFMTYFGFTPENIAEISERRQSRHVVAMHHDQPVAFLEFTGEGENYLSRHPGMINICGAFTSPNWRGKGLMRALLAAAMPRYRDAGITTVGVDYETINPEARLFWESIFTPYTIGWERRRDRKLPQ